MAAAILALLLAGGQAPVPPGTTENRQAGLPVLRLAPRGEVLRVAVAGDTGDGAEAVTKGIRRVHGQTPLDGIVLTGDNFYPCGPVSVDDPRWSLVRPLTEVGVPIFAVLGNHDHCGKGGIGPQLQAHGVVPRWNLPARQYAIRTPLADFAMLDTSPYVWRRNRDAEEAVRTVFARSTARFRIVVGHHPILSSGWHGYFPRKEVQRMRESLPLLRESRVDLYICGHDHHLELVRGRPAFLVSGAGSDPIPPIKLRARTVYPEEVRMERVGFAVVEVTTEKIRIRFFDGNGRPKSGWL